MKILEKVIEKAVKMMKAMNKISKNNLESERLRLTSLEVKLTVKTQKEI